MMALSRDIGTYFSKCIKGYHRFNANPIKEALWEEINAQVLNASGHTIEGMSKGSHQPGADLRCSAGSFSNKSTKYDMCGGGDSMKISSYRLSQVCNNKKPGDIQEILAEIQRRKNFTHYSILVRKESPTEIHYDWFLVPADHPAMSPENYEWSPNYNKQKEIIGWKTNRINGSFMSIVFSMSSQLWISVRIDDSFTEFKVASCNVPIGTTCNYIDLYEMFASSLTLSSGDTDAAPSRD
jgi:hypothetical protein